MGVYDEDLILSWTPHEYLLKLKGAQHARIDEFEKIANAAIMNSRANNEKRMTVKKLYDADKYRRFVDKGTTEEKEIARMVKLNESVKDFRPNFIPKGGK